ncbi:MAG: YfaZ family outer membrane protein [Nevskiales bacterium]|nr:YfaZ family outer membrane protein [Nevskiales bacterium]
MKRTLLLMCLGLAVTTVRAGSLDVNLNDDVLRAVWSDSLSSVFSGMTGGRYELGGLVGDEDDQDLLQGHLGALITGDAGASKAKLIAGLGGRLAVVDVEQVSGSVLALGGMFDVRLPDFNRIGIVAYGYGAPKASSFGDLEGYLEYAVGVDYQVIREASVYLAYRQLKLDVENICNTTVENGWHLGLKLNF